MADGYGSNEALTTYLSAKGYSTTGLDMEAASLAAARARGSDYVDGTYSLKFLGIQAGGLDQDREWPRVGVVGIAVDAVPNRVERASYEAAYLELSNPGSLRAVSVLAERIIREKIGSLETQYAAPTGDATIDAVPIVTVIDGILKPLLRTGLIYGAMVV